jgi:galactitol-specific phosphotransferase system IIC component
MTAQHLFRVGLAVAILRKLTLDWDVWNMWHCRIMEATLNDRGDLLAAVRTMIRIEADVTDDHVMSDALTGVLILLCP